MSLSYGFSVPSSTVVMTADRVLKVCNSGLVVMYGQPHIINFHLIQALRSFCVFITVLTVGIFRFVTLGHPSSSPIPPTWRWWALSPGWRLKSFRACLSQRPVTPTPMVWWVGSTVQIPVLWGRESNFWTECLLRFLLLSNTVTKYLFRHNSCSAS